MSTNNVVDLADLEEQIERIHINDAGDAHDADDADDADGTTETSDTNPEITCVVCNKNCADNTDNSIATIRCGHRVHCWCLLRSEQWHPPYGVVNMPRCPSCNTNIFSRREQREFEKETHLYSGIPGNEEIEFIYKQYYENERFHALLHRITTNWKQCIKQRRIFNKFFNEQRDNLHKRIVGFVQYIDEETQKTNKLIRSSNEYKSFLKSYHTVIKDTEGSAINRAIYSNMPEIIRVIDNPAHRRHVRHFIYNNSAINRAHIPKIKLPDMYMTSVRGYFGRYRINRRLILEPSGVSRIFKMIEKERKAKISTPAMSVTPATTSVKNEVIETN